MALTSRIFTAADSSGRQKGMDTMKRVIASILVCSTMLPLFCEAPMIQLGPVQEGSGKQRFFMEVTNISGKAIQALNLCRRSSAGLHVCTLAVFGMGGVSKPIAPTNSQKIVLANTLEEKLAPQTQDFQVDLVYFTDGTTSGPDKEQKTEYVKGMLAAKLAATKK
jgi:hypothetical protein